MTLYLDTEFNGFGGKLISLALVSDQHADEFYEVLPAPTHWNRWVADNVVPHLDKSHLTPQAFVAKLREFVKKYSNEVIVADWPSDIEYLM